MIDDLQNFVTYEEAETYVESQGSSYYEIVGRDPFVSPVPLEKLEHYELIYQSDTVLVQRGEETVSSVEIFEYSP